MLCGVIAGAVAVLAWHNRDQPSALPMFVLTGAGFAYAATNGLSSLVHNAMLTELFALARYPTGALIAIGVLYTAVVYTDRNRLQQSDVLTVVAGFFLLDTLAIFTNVWHGQLLDITHTSDGLYLVDLSVTYYLVHLIPSFLLVAIGLGFLLFEFAAHETHRKQTSAVITGISIPFAFFVVENSAPVHRAFNVGVLGIALGSIVLLWAFFYADLLETVPVARQTLMEHMDEAVIALDRDGVVIDANAAATELLAFEGEMVGSQAQDVFVGYPDLIERFEDAVDTQEELSLQMNGETRYYDLNITPIEQELAYARNGSSATVGRLVVVRDITERRLREKERNFLKQVFARVLRHNIRNDLNVIKGNAKLLAERAGTDDEDIAQTLEECTDDVLELSEKARELESIIDSSATRQSISVSRAIDNAVSSVEDSYPDATIDVNVDRGYTVLAHQSLEIAIENLLENACEHTDDPPATVAVRVRAAGETVAVTVDDDGPGIPDHELKVLDAESESVLQHGSGLGLWIVKWIVDRSDGTIDIECDDGTRATIELTRTTERRASTAEQAA